MSKYKKGDKFICEIKEVINCERATLYRSNFNTLVFDDYGLDRLPKYVEPDNKVGYREGCADTWGMVREIDLMPHSKKIEIFGYADLLSILDTYDPEEAAALLVEYRVDKEKQEIKYGDEVKHPSGHTGIVVHVNEHKLSMRVYWKETRIVNGYEKGEGIEKTGRNFADKLDALMNEIGGNDGKEETDS